MEKLSKLKRLFNKIYYNTFIENFCFNKKINFINTKKFNRWDLIQEIINKKKYKKYLEIGCDDDLLFSKITANKKMGVDPKSGGNIRKTSDEFFDTNIEKFDLIFIDGLHVYDQVKKDIKNSLNFLNHDGLILIHDCLPSEMSHQAVPRYRHYWLGDVWKAIVYFRKDPNLNIYTCKIETGISVIKKELNENILDLAIKDCKKLKFKDFYNNYEKFMRLYDYDKFLEKVSN